MNIRLQEEFDTEILERYDIIEKIGKGASSVVYKALDKITSNYIALRKLYDILSSKKDCEKVYRELNFLEHFKKQNNIIKLLNVVISTNNHDVYLIYELMEANLFNVSRAKILTEQHVKYITYQILLILKYIHSADVIHRDLKPSHILLNSDCKVKLSDLALCVNKSEISEYRITEYISMRWYRAPEILLNSYDYDSSIDMWALGCIIVEMLSCRTLFPGSCTLNQISIILEYIGRPSDEDIAAIKSPLASGILENIKNLKYKDFRNLLPNVGEDTIDFIEKILQFNPNKRLKVDEALEHQFVADYRIINEEIVCKNKLDLTLSEEKNYIVINHMKLKESLTRVNTSN